jgi:hypothetical protein
MDSGSEDHPARIAVHYGRWAFIGDGWCWVPGSFDPSPVFAPALVGFLCGPGCGLYVIGTSKRLLAAAIGDAEMRYVHLQALGTPPGGRLAGRAARMGGVLGILEENLFRPKPSSRCRRPGKSP